jgi:Skp family chaperone for outer membrane proteins
MRNIRLTLAFTVLLGAVFFVAAADRSEAQAAEKFGYVDLLRVFDNYEKTKEYEDSLTDKEEQKTEERKGMVDEIRKLKDELELLADDAKAEKQNEIDEKIKELQTFDMATRDELAKERDDMLRNLLKEIDDVVSDYAKREGYLFIFNSRFLIYADDSIDITDDIIQLLNK